MILVIVFLELVVMQIYRGKVIIFGFNFFRVWVGKGFVDLFFMGLVFFNIVEEQMFNFIVFKRIYMKIIEFFLFMKIWYYNIKYYLLY